MNPRNEGARRSRLLPWLPFAFVLVASGLAWLLPERAGPLRLEVVEEAAGRRLLLSGPRGCAYALVAGRRFGPYLASRATKAFFLLHGDEIDALRGQPLLSGTIPDSGSAWVGDPDALARGEDCLIQAGAAPPGRTKDDLLVSNAVARIDSRGVTPRYVSARAYASVRHGTALRSALAASFALSVVLAVRRRPAPLGRVLLPVLLVGIGVAVVLGSKALPSELDLRAVLRSDDEKLAGAYGRPFVDLVRVFRDLEVREARVVAVLHESGGSQRLHAAHLLAPRLRIDQRHDLPADLAPYAAVVAFDPVPDPPGFERILSGDMFTLFLRKGP